MSEPASSSRHEVLSLTPGSPGLRGTDNRKDVAKYVIAVEVPSHAAHSEHDADPGFQEFNRLADLLQPEDPLVYGGEVLHAV